MSARTVAGRTGMPSLWTPENSPSTTDLLSELLELTDKVAKA